MPIFRQGDRTVMVSIHLLEDTLVSRLPLL